MPQKTRKWKLLRRLRRTEGRLARRRHRVRKKQGRARRVERVPSGEMRIRCPLVFALEGGNHDPLVIFLREIRQAAAAGGAAVCLDFRATRNMVSGGTLLFYAELSRLIDMYPVAIWRTIPSKDDTVNQVLEHLGIYAKLNYKSAVVPVRGDVTSWRTASASGVDGDLVGKIVQSYASYKPSAKYIFRGAAEAMINVVNHAYTDSRGDGLPRPPEEKWWMFCRQDDKNLAVAVCDLGIGIPRSLPTKYPSEILAAAINVMSRGRKSSDARMIEAAMEIQRTSTDKRGRGKGLSDLKRIVDEVPAGQLYLFSNKGLVKYQGGAYQRTNYEMSIKGTVVLWMIPLGGE